MCIQYSIEIRFREFLLSFSLFSLSFSLFLSLSLMWED